MKLFVLLLLSLLPLAPLQAAPESHPYVVYAEFQQETTVELSDGTQWVMDAGDCFPIYMFKENQTKVVLQLGSNTFRAETGRVKVLKDGEAQRGLASYRKTLENYLKSKSDAWKRDAR